MQVPQLIVPTANPAQIAGMEGKIGQNQTGYFADLVVLRGDLNNPYRAVINAVPQDVALTVISGKAYYGDPNLLNQVGAKGQYAMVDACGKARGLRMTDPETKTPGNTQSLSDLTTTFTTDGVKSIIPLFQCDAAPEWAFQGISQ